MGRRWPGDIFIYKVLLESPLLEPHISSKAYIHRITVHYKTRSSGDAVGGVWWGGNICTVKYCWIIYL